MDFKIIKDGEFIQECTCCGQKVPLTEVDNPIFGKIYKCFYCVQLFGTNPASLESKNIGAAMNMLERRILDHLDLKLTGIENRIIDVIRRRT